MKAYLALEDGTFLTGEGFGVEGKTTGELVFETAMTGYVEALTDPSYNGQILMPTYPQVGNYGVCEEDYQSEEITAEALVIRDLCRYPSNYKSEKTLADFLKEYDIPGIEGVDTRMLTRNIREQGSMKAVVRVGGEVEEEELVKEAREQMSIKEKEYLVPEMSIDQVQRYEAEGDLELAMIDCGYKKNILERVLAKGINVTLYPHNTPSDEILEDGPDGVLVSNGPGNPALLDGVISCVDDLIGKVPVSGICLGAQIISLALGAETFKLKFGHRGINHPVKDIETGRVFISTQNHGFAVTEESLEDVNLEATQMNLNDDTIEAVEHKDLPILAVQYHPEAGPGPHDTYFFFDELKEMLED